MSNGLSVFPFAVSLFASLLVESKLSNIFMSVFSPQSLSMVLCERISQDSDKQYPLFVEDVILYPSFLSEFIAFHTAFLDTPSFSARYCPEISSPLCASSSERMSFFTDIVLSFQEIICIYGIV